jgi:hypothetical protein
MREASRSAARTALEKRWDPTQNERGELSRLHIGINDASHPRNGSWVLRKSSKLFSRPRS